MAEPTPRPWHILNHLGIDVPATIESPDIAICALWAQPDRGAVWANAHILAAAPDLLAVCEQVAQLAEYEYSSLIVDAAKAAIAKARGLKL